MGYWKHTYRYYDKAKADSVFKSLKKEGMRVRMTKRKLSAHDRKLFGSSYIYTIYRWRVS